MKKFIDLSPEESNGLDLSLYENAIKLKKDAFLIANNNQSYSSATSLLILSLEEVVKAVLILLHSEGYKTYEMEGAKKFFFDHKIRHDIAKLLEIGFGIIESSETYYKQKENPLFNEKWGKLGGFLNEAYGVIKAVDPLLKSGIRIEKLKKFNVLKNKGFYVDYRNELKVPFEEIKKEKYDEVKEVVERTFKSYNGLKKVFDTIPKDESEANKLKKAKMELRIFIDDALDGFSFKDLN